MRLRLALPPSLALAVLLLAALFFAAPGNARAATFFSPTSMWNQALPADVALDPDSDYYVRDLARQAAPKTQGGYGASIATTQYGVPIYTVGPDQPRVTVKLDGNSPLLSAAFQSVPLPDEAVPAGGTDLNLAIYQPSTDTMWEFWRISKGVDGWHASFGGKKTGVSQDPGYYRELRTPDGKSFVERCFWGAPSSKFALVGGVIRISELQAGNIPHALMLALPEVRATVRNAPAQNTDGKSTAPYSIPMGTQFRIDPRVDLTKLNLSPAMLTIARAVQKYGMIVGNRSGGVGFRAEDPMQYGTNPYPALFGKQVSLLMREFPWSKLQTVKLNLKSGNCITNP